MRCHDNQIGGSSASTALLSNAPRRQRAQPTFILERGRPGGDRAPAALAAALVVLSGAVRRRGRVDGGGHGARPATQRARTAAVVVRVLAPRHL